MVEDELINAVETVIRYVENQLTMSNSPSRTQELEKLLNSLYNLKWEIQKVRGD
jgi:hypothetical protein